MIASWPATKNLLLSDLDNVGQDRHLQKLLYLSHYILPNFYRNDGNVVGNKNYISITSAKLKNIGQGQHLQKSLYLGYYIADFNQTFTKIIQLGLTATASH